MQGVSFSAFGLWLGLNLLLMLALALNVTRFRFRVGAGGATDEELQRVIRAHGNNIEYVPISLLGLGILTAMGLPSLWVHVAGAALLFARLYLAYYRSLPSACLLCLALSQSPSLAWILRSTVCGLRDGIVFVQTLSPAFQYHWQLRATKSSCSQGRCP